MDNTIIDLDEPPTFHQEEWICPKKYTLTRIFCTSLSMSAPRLWQFHHMNDQVSGEGFQKIRGGYETILEMREGKGSTRAHNTLGG